MKTLHKLLVVASSFAIFTLSGCGPKEVSFDTTETARAQALENAQYNAIKFRSTSPQYAGFSIQMQGDSSQTASCPQGDGFASGKLVSPEANKVVRIKCSTISATVGCMLDEEFKTKNYAEDDGRCQPTSKVPFPITKIAK